MNVSLEMIGTIVSCAVAVGGAMGYVGRKLDALTHAISALNVKMLEEFVADVDCSERRGNCPCVVKFEGLEKRMDNLETKD